LKKTNTNSGFSIIITTYNRVEELRYTISKTLTQLDSYTNYEILILDDASDDLTWNYLQELTKNPIIRVFRNVKREGLINNRNFLISESRFSIIICLDDDINALSSNWIDSIYKTFDKFKEISFQTFNVFWAKTEPTRIESNLNEMYVADYLGCAHAFYKEIWQQLIPYPSWYFFYGEEQFIGYQLFKIKSKIMYNPNVTFHHRVDNKNRIFASDYYWRLRKAMRANWNNQLIFTPLRYLLFNLTKSVVKNGIQKFSFRDYRLTLSWILALLDIVRDTPRRFEYRKLRLTTSEWNQYKLLPPAPIYWDGKS
jgi:glycosyltransferase involved in cell wall biosynthesis